MASEPGQLDYPAMLDGLAELVSRFRADGVLLYGNAAYCRLFDLDRDSLIGQSWVPVVHPDDLQRVRRLVASITPENPVVDIENRVVLPSGEVRWVLWSNRGFFDAQGALVEVQAAGRDVTERVLAEQALARSHDRFRFLAGASTLLASSLEFETMLERVVRLAVPFLGDSCTVSLVGDDGIIHRLAVAHVDPELERALGAQETGRHQSELSEGLRRLIDPVLRGETVVINDLGDAHLASMQLDAEAARLARLQAVCALVLVPLVARDRILGGISFSRSRRFSNCPYDDEEIELARELASRAALALDNARLFSDLRDNARAKDRFLATLAHELRNPLAAVQHAIDLLVLRGDSPEVRARALDVARRQVRHQSRLVDDLLDVSRLTRGIVQLRPEKLDAGALIRQVVESMRPAAEAAGQALEAGGLDAGAWVDADPSRLQQIVENLVDNAIKYSDPGARTRVVVEADDRDVRLCVRDQGRGIPAEVRDTLFDAFVQGVPTHARPSSGLGIGLTIVRELVELHGGTIRIESQAGGGTLATVRLARVPAPGGQQRALRVLVVDDNRDAADLLASLIELWGYEVRAVHDGASALVAAAELEPDVVLLDLAMPGMDGHETAAALRASGTRATLVAVSGYTQDSDVARALAAGFDQHLGKPVDPDALERLLGRQSPP